MIILQLCFSLNAIFAVELRPLRVFRGRSAFFPHPLFAFTELKKKSECLSFCGFGIFRLIQKKFVQI
jgi:hypothetical protein